MTKKPEIDLYKQIMEADDLPLLPVKIPEWNCTVYIKTMTGDDKDNYEQLVRENNLKGNKDDDINLRGYRSLHMSLVVCRKDGSLLFSESDLTALGKKSGKALDRIFTASTKHNALAPEEIAQIEKN